LFVFLATSAFGLKLKVTLHCNLGAFLIRFSIIDPCMMKKITAFCVVAVCMNGLLYSQNAAPSGAVKKVFYLNSYHPGNGLSDEPMKAVGDKLNEEKIDWVYHFLDAKRNPDSKEVQQRLKESLDIVNYYKPSLIIVSDDEAVKFAVLPHFKQGSIPVLFCGVDWSCQPYGLPTPHITGILEIVPVEDTIITLRAYYPKMKNITILSDDSSLEQGNQAYLAPLYRGWGLEPEWITVSDYNHWKQAYLLANQKADVIYLPTNGTIRDWNATDARNFVKKNLRKPSFTCNDFMMPYAMFGYVNVPREQGEWIAQTALDILNGKSPKDIPVAKNAQKRAYWNPTLSKKAGFKPKADLLEICRKSE